MFCTRCGSQIAQEARFCPSCGAPVAYAGQAQQPQQPAGFDPSREMNPTVYGPPPAPTPKKSGKALIVVLVIVIIALALGILFLLGRNGKSETAASEPAAVEQPSAPESEPAPEPQPDPTAIRDAAIKDAIAEGYQVFEGEVRIMSNEELAEYQGVDKSMFPTAGTFAVVILNHETTVDGMSGDGSGMRTQNASIIGVAEYSDYESFVIDSGDLDLWRPYEGQTVAIAVRAEDLWFPSDVSLPVGEPRTDDARILG